jgi:hypothetical protein
MRLGKKSDTKVVGKMTVSTKKTGKNLIIPQVGMLATVRNRRALVSSVDPFDGAPEGRLHLVRLEYTDSDGIPEDQIIWEREINATLLEPTALPQVATEAPMPSYLGICRITTLFSKPS